MADNDLIDKCWRAATDFDISVRLANCLRNADIKYIGELAERSPRDLLKLDNFGPTTLREVKKLLSKLEMHLEMQLGDWSKTPPTRDSSENVARSFTERKILSAIAQMPFGSSIHALIGQRGETVTLEQLATYLEELRAVLATCAKTQAAEREELGRLRADLSAVRRVFGVVS